MNDISSNVVVGIRDLARDGPALLWAADEARARGHALTVVRVTPLLTSSATIEVDDDLAAEVVALLRHQTEPPVSVRHVRGRVEDVLVDAGDTAQLVVLGIDHRHGRGTHGILGSVEDRVVVHSSCPVVVIPSDLDASKDPDQVVVVVNGRDRVDGPALLRAAREAQRREMQLLVIRTDLRLGEVVSATTGTRSTFDEALAEVHWRSPDLRIDVVHERVDEVDVWAPLLQDTALVVASSRHDDTLWAIDAGTLATDLMRSVRRPLMLVPTASSPGRGSSPDGGPQHVPHHHAPSRTRP